MAERRKHARWLLAALVAAALAGIAWLFLHTPPVGVDLGRADRGDVEVTVGHEGIARVRQVYAVAAPVAGRLLRVDAEVGDPVAARRTTVARLLPADPGFLDQRGRRMAEARLQEARAQVRAATAETERARTALALARRQYDRVAPLAASGTLSRAALDRARADRDAAAAALAGAQASAEVARNAVAEAQAQLTAPMAGRAGRPVEVRAPVSGTVLRILQKSEAVVAAGTPILEVGDPEGDLEVVADLLSQDAVRVSPGARAYIENWGGPRPLPGRVTRVEPFGVLKVSALGIEEQRVNVRIALDPPPADLRGAAARLGHGYRIEARVVTDAARGVVRVPASALFRDGGRWAVYAVEDGRARLRHLDVGLRNDSVAEVRRGLQPGAAVVLFPGEHVRDGVRIRVREA